MEKLLHGKLVRSSGNLISVTDLQNIYNEIRNLYGWSGCDISSTMISNKFIKCIYDLIYNNKNYDSPILINENYLYSDFKIECDTYGATKVLKRLGVWKTTGARHTKQTMCDERIWKFLYINIFNEYSSVNIPEWIKNIDIDVYKFSIKRAESLEMNFINQLLPKIDLFLDTEPMLQYKLGNYIYDIFIKMFDKKILIEYNEITHNQKSKEDFEKSLYAIKNDYYILHIPQGKENDIKSYLYDIIKGNLCIEDCLEISNIRFNELVEHDYDKEINIKIFNNENNKSRLKASYNELKNIIDIKYFITNAVHNRFIKNANDIKKAVKQYKI